MGNASSSHWPPTGDGNPISKNFQTQTSQTNKGEASETTSRNRQPSNVQNMFSSLRLVERAVKKQLKEGQISETLAAKFNWEKLAKRQRRERPTYILDRSTNMRLFNLD